MDDDGLGAGQAVGGQLHDKGDGLPLEDRVLEQQPVEHAHDHAADVQPDHHQRRRVREEGSRKRRVDGEFCGAGHEGREQNRHAPVALAGQRARGHDRRHRAAKADQHRHERPAGEPDLAQQLVHHERDARHVPAVLQDGEEEEQRHDRGQEGQNRSDAHAHAVDQQGVHRRVDPEVRQRLVQQARQPVDPQREPVREQRADDVERQEERQQHHAQEDRDAEVLVRQSGWSAAARGRSRSS